MKLELVSALAGAALMAVVTWVLFRRALAVPPKPREVPVADLLKQYRGRADTAGTVLTEHIVIGPRRDPWLWQ